MRNTLTFAGIGIICIIAVICAGCLGAGSKNPATSPPQTSGTPVQVGHIVVNEEQNNATTYVDKGSLITLELKENPTTGYQWNLTTTTGLVVTGDRYVPSDATGQLVGSGGTHIWDMTAVQTGDQKITAVYKRSWEAVTGNEQTFSMTIVVR
ncbi:MAG: protease inhibitor I42 family protein [Methanoregula sp.]|jgi:inhibitor of cysteine peptidase